MSIQRLAREVKKIALRDNLSDAVVREALGHLKAVGSAEGAVEAAVEQLVHRARVAKKYPDLARNPQHTKPITTRLLQMGFAAHELENLVPSGSAKLPTKTPAPARPKTAVPMRAKPSAPAKNTARRAASILERKRAINERLRREERGGK